MVKRGSIYILLALTLALVMPAYWLLFSTLMAHDDEGYVLISLQNYAAHGGLYTQVFSQYGPFFYFLHDLAHRLLNYEFNNTVARFITLGCWLVTCLACAHLVWRQTRNLFFSAATLFATFIYLQLMVNEPVHPGGLIAALVALAVWAGAGLIDRRAIGSLAVMSALAGAALLLTKINVGIFFIVASGTWFVLHLRQATHQRTGGGAIAVVVCLLPLALMKSELHESWAWQFAVLSGVASLTMLMAGWTIRFPLTQWKFAGYGLISGATLITVVTGCIAYRGTSFQSIFDGVVLSPLRQPGIYHFAPDWKPASLFAAGVSVAIAASYLASPNKIKFRNLILGIRLVAGFSLGLASCHWFPFSFHSSVMSYLIPWGWLMVVPLESDEPRSASSIRLWIGLVLTLQYLHAYPVAGSQTAWGTFLAIPLVALGLHNASAYLTQISVASSRVILLLLATFPVLGAAQLGLRGWHQYQESPPLSLPGAENIRPPRAFSSALRMVATNAKVHGDMLFSLPGMFSFNGWTGLPTPTFNNTTHWFTLLNERQQREIADALLKDTRSVVIVHQGMLKFLSDGHFSLHSPLADFLDRNFSKAFTVDDFEFRIRRGRKIVPVNTAEFFHLPKPLAGFPDHKLELVVEIPPGEKIACVELVTLADSPTVLARWNATDTQFQWTPVSPGDEAILVGPHETHTRSRLIRIHIPLREAVVADPKNTMVLIKNPDGTTISEARFLE